MTSEWNQHRTRSVRFGVLLLLGLAAAFGLTAKEKKEELQPIRFTPRGGIYATNVILELAVHDGPGKIHYTIDGSSPDESSPVYSAPLVISKTVLVRARLSGTNASQTVALAEVYTLLDPDLDAFHSTLPLVVVNAFGSNITHDQKIEGAMQVIGAEREPARLTNAVAFSGRALLNIRGRASLRYPKNSFTIKTMDGEGDPEPDSILGFPADTDWVLYAPYPDKTLMRDVLAYELHEQMGHWAPRTRFVEVFVNRAGARLGRRDYAGVYVFEERIKRGKARVDIAKLKADDDAEPRISGGYIFKKDHTDQGAGPMGGEGYGAGATFQNTRVGYPTRPGGFPADPKGFGPAATVTRSSSSSSSRSSRSTPLHTNHLGFASNRLPAANRDTGYRDEYDSVKDEESFKTTRTNQFYFVEPGLDEITAVQKSWLKKHLNDLEAALYGGDFRDPVKGYPAFIDPGSFIDYHLITEMTKNVDGYRFSVFYHKDRGEKIHADPIWDWNLSFGNANGKQGWMPEFWLWPQLDDKECTWYRRLFDDPDFGQRYVDRWAQLRTNVFATKKILARVDELAGMLQEPQKRNYEKWPILGRAINPNYFVGATYDEEVSWMKKFIESRLDWMEKQFPPVPRLEWKAAATGHRAELSAASGEIYVTLDGTDPRVSGGGVSSSAQLCKAPLTLKPGVRLFARVRQQNRWSGPLVWGR
ncbi:MAG: hypothetical protein QOF48_3554 [Verrucomicrobiota bacterium]